MVINGYKWINRCKWINSSQKEIIAEPNHSLNLAEAEYEKAYQQQTATSLAYGTCSINHPDDKKRLEELWKRLEDTDRIAAEKYSIAYKLRQKLLKLIFETQESYVYRKVLRVSCSFCHNYFYTYSKTRRYCHYGCVKQGYLKRRKERYLESLKGKACKMCQKTFTANRKDMVYCSKSCKQLSYRKRKLLPISS